MTTFLIILGILILSNFFLLRFSSNKVNANKSQPQEEE